uniref:Uncharacterized protein n=1 Tax=Leptospira ellisii TaxID=2023197 RepID=A0A2N0BAE0_9LEPT|nr:hypothetical protein CH379_07450 [Leptospira ellisii]
MPRSLEGNLYWGAAYGAESFFKRKSDFKIVERIDGAPGSSVLRKIKIERIAKPGESNVTLHIHAYAGDRIDEALEHFLRTASGKTKTDLLVWAGHDRLMDRPPPEIETESRNKQAVAVLACESEKYFGPVLRSLRTDPIAMTRTFMAPEAYLLEALADTAARSGIRDKRAVRSSLIRTYSKYQKISERAAGTVFSRLD